MIIPSYSPAIGGAEVQAQRLSAGLMRKGWPIQILTRRHISKYDNLPAREIVNNIRVSRVYSRGGERPGMLLFLWSGLCHLLIHGRGDIYHAHDVGTSGWMAVIASHILGGRSLIKLRTGLSVYKQRYSSGFAAWQFSTLLREANCVIVVNREVEDWLVNQLGIPASKIAFLPNSVDLDEFSPNPVESKNMIRARLGLSSDKTIYLYIGRLSLVKGVDILLRAWSVLPENILEEANLLIVGDGPQDAALHQLCVDLDISDRVFLLGFKQDVRDFYHAADVFLLPSRAEGLSNALLEAMACGLPVVASRIGGNSSLVTDGENGYLFTPDDHHACAQSIEKTFLLNGARREMGAKARQTVNIAMDLSELIERYHEIYSNLIES